MSGVGHCTVIYLFFFFSAFDVLLRNLPDLTLDTPDAATVLANFLARAIADDCIPPKVISIYREAIDSVEAK